MKLLLRYQVSGTTFLIWVVVFYFGSKTESMVETINLISQQDINLTLGGLVTALPLGVIIHQISVILKNLVFSILFDFDILSDDPSVFNFSGLISNKKDYVAYILERISNLNSFYYVRIDNGLLAPVFALLFCCLSLNVDLYSIVNELILMILILTLMLTYLPVILYEMKIYQKILIECKVNIKQ